MGAIVCTNGWIVWIFFLSQIEEDGSIQSDVSLSINQQKGLDLLTVLTEGEVERKIDGLFAIIVRIW